MRVSNLIDTAGTMIRIRRERERERERPVDDDDVLIVV